MPLINTDTLKSFLGKNFLSQNPEGLEAAIAQAEDIVLQKTRINIPASINDAIPTLQFVAHSIVCWIIAGMTEKLSTEEISRRRNLYEDAQKTLDDISKGKLILYDKTGTSVQVADSSDYYCNNDNRSERF